MLATYIVVWIDANGSKRSMRFAQREETARPPDLIEAGRELVSHSRHGVDHVVFVGKCPIGCAATEFDIDGHHEPL